MTQKDKELLLQDISARLLYGVKVLYQDVIMEIHNVPDSINSMVGLRWADSKGLYSLYNACIGEFKPYLRPLSSMTEVEKQIYETMSRGYTTIQIGNFVDWLNAHCLDYRGLIEKGLALEAPKNMYKA